MASSGNRARALLVVLVMLLTACGSTLQQQTGGGVVVDPLATGAPVAESANGSSTLSLGSGTSSASRPATTGTTPSTTSGTSTGGATAGTSGATGSAPASSGATGSAPTTGTTTPPAGSGTTGTAPASTNQEPAPQNEPATTNPGAGEQPAQQPASSEPLKVGFVTVNAGAILAVFGADAGDTSAEASMERYREYFNANGGFGGRPLEFFYEEVDVAEDQNAAAQRVCERFTQDNRMDLVFDLGAYPHPVLVSCLAQFDLSVFAGARFTADTDVDKVNMFTTSGVRSDRIAGQWIDLAVQQGYIGAGDKLGVLYEDCPWGRRAYNDHSVPTAQRHGIDTTFATVKCIENAVNDLGPLTNQARSAALRFQSELVTHVMVLSIAEGFVTGQFSRGAEDQQFRPAYLTTTNVFPYNNSNPSTQVGFHPNQREKVTGFGYIPLQDVGDEATVANAGQQQAQDQCKEVDPSEGGADAFEEGSQDHIQFRLVFLEQCDALFAMRAAASATINDLSIQALRANWRAALGSVPSALQLGGVHRVDAAGFDSVGLVRGYTFNPDDGRMSYSTPPLEIR